jgi:hypothetical protein
MTPGVVAHIGYVLMLCGIVTGVVFAMVWRSS